MALTEQVSDWLIRFWSLLIGPLISKQGKYKSVLNILLKVVQDLISNRDPHHSPACTGFKPCVHTQDTWSKWARTSLCMCGRQTPLPRTRSQRQLQPRLQLHQPPVPGADAASPWKCTRVKKETFFKWIQIVLAKGAKPEEKPVFWGICFSSKENRSEQKIASFGRIV